MVAQITLFLSFFRSGYGEGKVLSLSLSRSHPVNLMRPLRRLIHLHVSATHRRACTAPYLHYLATYRIILQSSVCLQSDRFQQHYRTNESF